MGVIAEAVRSLVWGERSWDPVLARLFGGQPVAAGVVVNEHTAMGYAPFAAAVNLIANTFASVPLHLYKHEGEGRERARGHPLDRLVSASPNADQSSFAWRRQVMRDVLVSGAGYCEIQREILSGRPVALWPINPHIVTPTRDESGRPVYRVLNARGGEVRLADEKVLVILGPGSPDGLTPASPVERAKQAIGVGLAAERFGASFFGNGAWPGLIAQHPGKLSPEAHTRLKESLNNALQGPSRAHGLIVTEEGIKIEKASIPPDASQFLETRQHQINEVARVYNLPPTLIGGNLEAGLTYANSVAEAQRFVDQCLLPWGTLWEQELNRKLLAGAERESHYFAATFEGLLRGDVTTRFAAYRVAIESGFMTPNEARVRENLPELPQAPPPSASNGASPRSRPDGADHVIVSEALARILRRWGADFLRAKSAEDVRKLLAHFAGEDEADRHTRQILETALALVPGVDARGVAIALRAECVRDIQRLLDTTSALHVPSRVMQLIDKTWPPRAGHLAAEIIRSGRTNDGGGD
jgi:HK97 family phage portal protein